MTWTCPATHFLRRYGFINEDVQDIDTTFRCLHTSRVEKDLELADVRIVRFTSCEFYMAYADYEQLMTMTEDSNVSHLCSLTDRAIQIHVESHT